MGDTGFDVQRVIAGSEEAVSKILEDIVLYGEARGKWEDGKLIHIPIGKFNPHYTDATYPKGDA